MNYWSTYSDYLLPVLIAAFVAFALSCNFVILAFTIIYFFIVMRLREVDPFFSVCLYPTLGWSGKMIFNHGHTERSSSSSSLLFSMLSYSFSAHPVWSTVRFRPSSGLPPRASLFVTAVGTSSSLLLLFSLAVLASLVSELGSLMAVSWRVRLLGGS